MAAKKVKPKVPKPPKFRVVVIHGKDDVTPLKVRLRRADRLCFVNPNGTAFTVKFKGPSPLTRAVGRVSAYSPSRTWYQLSSTAVYEQSYKYTTRTRATRGEGSGPGGPEIVPAGG